MVARKFFSLWRVFCLLLLLGLLGTACGSKTSSPGGAGQGGQAQGGAGGGSGGSSSKELTIEQIANLKDAQRQQILEAGAKKEGSLTWYTTLIVDGAVRPMVTAFEKKYPFIKVDYYRGNSADVFQKAKAESDSGKFVADVLDGTASVPEAKKAGLLRPFSSPSLADYPAEFKDPQGYWAAQNVYYMMLGYNTEMVPASQVPKSYEDLLDPRWKGKITWSTSSGSGGPQVVGGILLARGEEKGKEFLGKLTQQNIRNNQGSGRQVLDTVIAGEYPLGLNMFHDHILNSIDKGAPVQGAPLEPVNSTAQIIGLLKTSPHPYAAMLFLDFFFSVEGQTVMRDVQYTPANLKVAPRPSNLVPQTGKFKFQFMSPEYVGENNKKWEDIYKQLFLK